MLSIVTPSRRGNQLSSSVSMETINGIDRGMGRVSSVASRICGRALWGSSPEPHAESPRQIEGSQPLAAPCGAERHQLARGLVRGGPVPLVGLVSPQEIEPPVAAFNGAADHPGHKDEAYAVPFPTGVTTALVEKNGVATSEPVPRGRRMAVDVQRREPQLPAACDRVGEA